MAIVCEAVGHDRVSFPAFYRIVDSIETFKGMQIVWREYD